VGFSLTLNPNRVMPLLAEMEWTPPSLRG
jgi:hypothetical protein